MYTPRPANNEAPPPAAPPPPLPAAPPPPPPAAANAATLADHNSGPARRAAADKVCLGAPNVIGSSFIDPIKMAVGHRHRHPPSPSATAAAAIRPLVAFVAGSRVILACYICLPRRACPRPSSGISRLLAAGCLTLLSLPLPPPPPPRAPRPPSSRPPCLAAALPRCLAACLQGATDDDTSGVAYCQCQRGKKATGPGAIPSFDFGPWGAMKGWSLWPTECGAKCGCG